MENFSTRLRKFMEETGVNDNQITIRSGLSNGIIRRVVREAKDEAKTKKNHLQSQRRLRSSRILHTYTRLSQ